jgi:RNA polymerase-binding transcription factor DksA
MKKCRSCSNDIELERLEILPNTCACASCAQKMKLGGSGPKGRIVYSHKTAGEIQIMTERSFNETKMYYEPNGARSSVKNFSRAVCA